MSLMKPLIAMSCAMCLFAGCESDGDRVDDRDYDVTRDTVGTRPADTGSRDRIDNISQVERDFVRDAISSGMFEVQSSQLAMQQAGDDPDVRSVAQLMIDDHTRVNRELRSIASDKNMYVPQQMTSQHRQMLDRLRNAADANFAKTYLDQQIRAHEEWIAMFERASNQVNDRELRDFADKTLSILRRHLQHIEQHAVGDSMDDRGFNP